MATGALYHGDKVRDLAVRLSVQETRLVRFYLDMLAGLSERKVINLDATELTILRQSLR